MTSSCHYAVFKSQQVVRFVTVIPVGKVGKDTYLRDLFKSPDFTFEFVDNFRFHTIPPKYVLL